MRISDWSSDVCSSDLIRHQTIVHYDAPVQLARLNLRLRPAPWPGQWTSDYHLAVDPAPASIESRPGAWRSEERRVGKECGSTCRYRWSAYHEKKNKKKYN